MTTTNTLYKRALAAAAERDRQRQIDRMHLFYDLVQMVLEIELPLPGTTKTIDGMTITVDERGIDASIDGLNVGLRYDLGDPFLEVQLPGVMEWVRIDTLADLGDLIAEYNGVEGEQ